MGDYDKIREVDEAIRAGENALQSLERAESMLNKASIWGLFDIFGGGLVTGIFKHARLREAQRCMNDARQSLAFFSRELQDIRNMQGIKPIVGDFLSFADFFFDGTIADIFVQVRIGEAKKQELPTDDELKQVVQQLYEYRRQLE